MSLLFALATVTASCVPSKSPELTREEVVDAYLAAMAAHDGATLGKYIKPGARALMGTDSMDLAEMMSALNPGTAMTVLDKKFNPDKTITVRIRTSNGGDGDEVSLSFAQDGGCVVSLTQV